MNGCQIWKTGNDLSSRLVSKQVFSALKVLTSVFGMRTGGTLSLKSPVMAKCLNIFKYTHNYILFQYYILNQVRFDYDCLSSIIKLIKPSTY